MNGYRRWGTYTQCNIPQPYKVGYNASPDTEKEVDMVIPREVRKAGR